MSSRPERTSTTEAGVHGPSVRSDASRQRIDTPQRENSRAVSTDRHRNRPVFDHAGTGHRVRSLSSDWRLGKFRYPAALGFTLLIGGIVQSLVATYLWGQADEGAYIQASLMIATGSFPLVTFPARPEVLLPLLMAPVLNMFGYNLLVGREIIVAFNLATALLLALMARRLAHSKPEMASLAAAAIYLLAPLAAFQGPTILEEPLAALFLAASLWFLLRRRWKVSLWNYPLSGGFLALAIMSRRSAFLVTVVWLAWIIFAERGWRARILSTLALVLPVMIGVGGFFLYVASKTSLTWVLLASLTHASTYQYVPTLPAKLEVFGYILFAVPPIFVAPSALAIRSLRSKGYLGAASVIQMISLSFVAGLFAAYPFEVQWGLDEFLTPYLSEILFLNLVLWFLVLVKEGLEKPGSRPIDGGVFFLLVGWGSAFLLVDFFARPEAFSVYFADALAPLSILFGIWFTTLFPPAFAQVDDSLSDKAVVRRSLRKRVPAITLVFLLVVTSAMSATLILGPSNPYNAPGTSFLPDHSIYRDPPSEIQAVGSYLRAVMQPRDTIFTFDSVFADVAGRSISPQIALYLDDYVSYMHFNESPAGSPFPGSPSGFLPSIDGLLSYWNETNLTWFVAGPLTEEALSYSNLLKWYIETEYHPVTTFGDPLSLDLVVVYERGAPPVNSLHLNVSRSLSSVPTAVVGYGPDLYYSSLNSSMLTRYDEVTGNWSVIPLAFPGARTLGIFFGSVWVGSTLTAQVEIIPMGGGSPEVLPCGSGPTGFASDSGAHMVFVTSLTSGEVTAYDSLPNSTNWRVAWETSLPGSSTGVTVNSTSQTLYVSTIAPNTVTLLNDRTGRPIQSDSLTFPPYSIVSVNGSILVSWWIGWVYKVGFFSNGSLELENATFVGRGINSLDAVPSMNEVLVPSAQQNVVMALSASTLETMGSFVVSDCPGAVFWLPQQQLLSATGTCGSLALLWHLPPPTLVNLSGPEGARATVFGEVAATYSLPVTLAVWPQSLEVGTYRAGFLPGLRYFTILPGTVSLDWYLTTGPSLSGIRSLQAAFVWEVVAASGAFFVGAMVLVFCPQYYSVPARNGTPTSRVQEPRHPPSPP